LYQQAAFGVIASGNAPLSYQWLKNGVAIAGATNDQIVLAQPLFSDAGLYSVVVANPENSVTSVGAALTVNPPKMGDVDCSFNCGGSIVSVAWAMAIQPNGKVLVSDGGIVRLNTDGTTDYTFVDGISSADGFVYSVAVQSDGKVLIGGNFTTLNGLSRN